MSFRLLVDVSRTDGPAVLVWLHGATDFPFLTQPDGPLDPSCGRCNRALNVHLWQFVDDDLTEDGGVIDCEVQS